MRRPGANWPLNFFHNHPADSAKIVMFIRIETDEGEHVQWGLKPNRHGHRALATAADGKICRLSGFCISEKSKLAGMRAGAAAGAMAIAHVKAAGLLRRARGGRRICHHGQETNIAGASERTACLREVTS
jgi:hypothetical protein